MFGIFKKQEKEVQEETELTDLVTVSISELKASILAIQSIAKKHLNKQSDYGGYHGGVNNTCKSVLFWIEQLEKENKQ